MLRSVAAVRAVQRNAGGKPIHPCHLLTEALIEGIAAIDNDAEAMEHAARASIAVAQALHQRSLRIRNHVRPEFVDAVGVAERFCAETTGARVAL